MILSEWREFPSAPCLAEKKNLTTARVSMWNWASLTCFLVRLRTYQHSGNDSVWECKKYLLYIWCALQAVIYLQFFYQTVQVYFSKYQSYIPPRFISWCYLYLRQQIIQCNDHWWKKGGKWSWLYQLPSWNFSGWNTYLLTSWCRVLLEKLNELQLVKKFPAFHGTRRFIWKQINTAENVLRNNVLRSHNHCYDGKATIRSPCTVGLYVTLNSTK